MSPELRRGLALGGVWLTLAATPCAADLASGPLGGLYSGAAVEGVIADADSGAPLAGAIVVARWEWLEYRPVLEGSQFVNKGHPLHVAEAVSGPDGRYALAAWGPKPAAGGHPDNHLDPLLVVFKPGYEPRVLRNEAWTDYMSYNPAASRASEWSGKTIALHRWTGTPQEYAQRIAAVQRGNEGLGWQYPGTDWKATPHMMQALRAEKARLEADGEGDAIYGLHEIAGHFGMGRVVEAGTHLAVVPAVVTITWSLRPQGGGPGRAEFVEQRRVGIEGAGANLFSVSPWRVRPRDLPPGWDIDPDVPARVTIHARGYRTLRDVRWSDAGKVLELTRRASGPDADLEELREWRRDVDAALARDGERERLMEGQKDLLWHLFDECRTLVPEARKGICFEADSEPVRFVERLRRRGGFVMETLRGPRDIRIVARKGAALGAGAPAGGMGLPAGAVNAPPIPIRGFSIEPARPDRGGRP